MRRGLFFRAGKKGVSRVASVAQGWRSVRLDEIEPIPVVGGTLLWRPVRRTLDVGAFGINSYVAPNDGDDVVEEHTEQSLGHEEVYVVLSGHATFSLDEETLEAPAGSLGSRPDPSAPRGRAQARLRGERKGGRGLRIAPWTAQLAGRGRLTKRSVSARSRSPRPSRSSRSAHASGAALRAVRD